MNKIPLTLTGENALAVKYAIDLARFRYREFEDMTDDEVLSCLIDAGLEREKEEAK